MIVLSKLRPVMLRIVFIFIAVGSVIAQKKDDDGFLGKADLYKSKKSAL